MEKAVFITDADTGLGRELVSIYLDNGFYVFGAVSKSDDDREKVKMTYDYFNDNKDMVKFEIWNRNSPVSSKGIFLKALTNTGEINRMILLGNPVFLNLNMSDIDFKSIELNIDSYIKGNLFLIKEVFNYYKGSGGFSEYFALVNILNNNPGSLLDEIVGNSLSTIFKQIIEKDRNKGLNICGFESKTKKIEEFAAYIFRLLENRNKRISGRVFKFTSGVIR
jgi:hypothetical protein